MSTPIRALPRRAAVRPSLRARVQWGIRAGIVAATLCPMTLHADPVLQPGLNTYGQPGLIETPVAPARPDAELSFTSSYSPDLWRNTASFQILPRLSGSFRYTIVNDFSGPGSILYDRSLSLHYVIAREGTVRPAIAVGVNDILGTGFFSSEYIVASKTITPRLQVTAGLGWGRLAEVGGFRNPLGVFDDRFLTRPPRTDPNDRTGGQLKLEALFAGDAALFGGLAYQATDRLRLMAEYAPDAYSTIPTPPIDPDSQINLGFGYALRDGIDLSGRYLYGNTLGVQLSFALNPKDSRSTFGGGIEGAPPPVRPRPLAAPPVAGWDMQPAAVDALTRQVARALEAEGLVLDGVTLTAERIRIGLENPTYLAWPQAVGRAARALTGVLPDSVETFVFVPTRDGLPLSEVTVQRSDLERLEFEFDNSWSSYARTRIAGTTTGPAPQPGRYPALTYALSPYLQPSLFDPDNPVRIDVGVRADVTARLAPGLTLNGVVRQRLLGNRDEATRPSNSVLPRVRSESNLYAKSALTLPVLTADYVTRLTPATYGRITAGYLESQFGGVSTELLWKPVGSRLALGVEVNYARQRGFDQRFDFRDYDVVTGHASAYYAFDNGFDAQLDVGRYLAGDDGATIRLARSFANGWSLGGYVTFTDVSFDDFGEGSFDKGIEVSIPIGWLSGQPTGQITSTTLQPILRDGGARLNVDGRLYDRVRDAHAPDMRETWGRFWR